MALYYNGYFNANNYIPITNKDIDLLLSYFKDVRQIPITIEQSKYYRPLDRLIIPKLEYTNQFYFTIAHELGHKQNDKLLLFLFRIFPIKAIQIMLEIDANKKALKYIHSELVDDFKEFSNNNLKTYYFNKNSLVSASLSKESSI